MVHLLRRNKGDKKSLLGRRRFFGKKGDRSDSVDGRSNVFSSKKKEEEAVEEPCPVITLEPVDNSKLNVTILTEAETPPVSPYKCGDEGSISDTISDMSASVMPMACVPDTKPPEPAEQMVILANHDRSQGGSQEGGSDTFISHRGNMSATTETKDSTPTTFSIIDMMDGACVMPWNKNPAVNTPDKDSLGPSWGVAPSEDDDDDISKIRTKAVGGGSPPPLNVAPSVCDTPPSIADDTIPSGAGDTQPSGVGMITSITEYPAESDETDGDSEEEEDDDEASVEESQEGYELVLDSKEDVGPKKSRSAVWKRMNITKARTVTPPVKDEDKIEKYRAVFGADPEPDRSMNKRTNSFFARLANGRSKTPESKMMDESRNRENAYDETSNQKPQMINLSEEVLNPEDLLDEEGERGENENMKSSRAGKDVAGAVAKTSAQEKKTDAAVESKKETISPGVSRSRSWNIASALKRSGSGGDQSKRASSDGGAKDDVNASSLGLLNLLSVSPKRAEKPKPEEPKPPKPVWKSAVDPNTGATYYYHRLTRVTTWTKPPDFDQQPVAKEGAQSLSAEKQKKIEEGVEVPATPGNVTSILRNISSSARSDGSQSRPYTKKQEQIKELLLGMSPPDPASVDKIIDEYRGREDELIDQLNEIVESQPFDEPLSKADKKPEKQSHVDGGEGEMKKAGSFRLPLSTKNRSLKNRVMTASSNFTGRSTTTGRSNISGNSRQTLKTGNTAAARNSGKLYSVVSDISKSSIDHTPTRPGIAQGRPPLPSKKSEANDVSPVKEVKAPSPHEPEMARGKSRRKQVEEQESSPVKVIKAPRNRELLVEEFSSKGRYGLKAEKYSGKALHGRRRPFRDPKPFVPHNESSEKYVSDGDSSELADSFATDSVSGLSASDAGFNTRKDEFDAAARSALDDAIRNRDWELAATVTDEMRGQNYHAAPQNDDDTPQEWTQTALDKFITDNDWDAVAKYIARMRDSNARKDPEIAHPPSNYSGGQARKRFGAKSQLQHDQRQNELEQSSSWDSGTSFGSEFYSTGSSETPDNSHRRAPSDRRKNFAC